MAESPSKERRVAVLAPRGRDAPLVRAQLERAGMSVAVCTDAAELRRVFSQGLGVLLLTSEALTPEVVELVQVELAAQEPWSDLPVVVLTDHQDRRRDVAKTLAVEGNVIILTRPLATSELLAVLRSALRARRRQYQLRDLLVELEAFNYSVSHDLRAPLRRILGFVQALEEESGAALSDSSRHYLERIAANARHMGALIENFLKLSRLTRGEVKKRPVDMTDLATRIANRLLEEREVALRIDPLPPAYGDEALLEIVFENLLRNAWKFTAPRERAEIHVRAQETLDETIYAVSDNGVGFDAANAERLFQAFQRLHDGSYEGLGIGLATVRRIIHHHGGRVWADGKPDAGATFYFSLPRTGAALRDAPSQASPR